MKTVSLEKLFHCCFNSRLRFNVSWVSIRLFQLFGSLSFVYMSVQSAERLIVGIAGNLS